MKHYLGSFFLVIIVLSIQNARSQEGMLKIEWLREFDVAKTDVSGLVLNNNQIYLSQTGETSILNVIDEKGIVISSVPAQNTRIRSLFTTSGFLYSMGDQHLTKRDFIGSIMSEYMLPWKDGDFISTLNGAILENSVYTYAFGDLMKFTLSGEQVFRKEVAKSCNSQNLKVGGSFIYIYSRISEPAFGPRLMQYDTLGNQKWSLPTGDVKNMVADADGNCYILVANGETTIVKYGTDGKEIWSKNTPGQWSRGIFVKGDSLFVCGNISPGAMTDNKMPCAYSIVSARTGEVISQQTVTISEDKNTFEHFSQIASDGQNIYIGGSAGNQYPRCFLLKLTKNGNTAGVQEAKSEKSFGIFPNPGGNRFTITCENHHVEPLHVSVRNISGQVVYKKDVACNENRSYTLDLGRQVPGTYFVEIISGKEKATKKIIVE